jgi:serine/threonine protein kinase
VPFYGLFRTSESQYIVIEYMCYGDLESYLDKNVGMFDLNEKLWMTVHIARGMNYIHSQLEINHNDLAARNVLVGLNDRPNEGKHILKVAGFFFLFFVDCFILFFVDFGLSLDKASENDYIYGDKNKQIPVRWAAPEVFLNRKYSEWSDVWSFAVTIWEIFEDCQKKPYWMLDSNMEVKKYVAEGNILEQPKSCPEKIWKILKNCWKKPAHTRPKFGDLIPQLLEGIGSSKIDPVMIYD